MRAPIGISLLLLASCAMDPDAPGDPEVPVPSTDGRDLALSTGSTLFEDLPPAAQVAVDLSDAPARDATPQGTLRPAPRPLTAAQTEAVLASLPPLPKVVDTGFRLAPEGPPPPVAAREAQTLAPPAPAPGELPPPVEDQRRLSVVRVAPAGEVPLAREIQVEMSHPMVALGGAEAAEKQISIQLEPALPPGQWRWVDPQLLVFEPAAGQLPGATTWTVTVPAGVASADGRRLAEPVAHTFSTRRPKVLAAHPARDATGLSRQPVVVLAFDQAVKRKTVTSLLTVNGDPVRPAREGEVARDREAGALIRRYGADRTVALVPVEALPLDAEVQVRLPVGQWSAEGPRPAEAPFRSRFRTYGRFEVEEQRCGWGRDCRPGMPFSIQLSNDLARSGQPQAPAQISPEVPGVEVRLTGRTVDVYGQTQAKTTYSVTLSPKLVDEHGQPLGAVAPLRFEVGAARPFLQRPSGQLVRRLPGQARIPVYSAGAAALDVRIHRVTPEDWGEWLSRGRRQGELPGTASFEGKIPVVGDEAAISETLIDISSALEEGRGHAVVEILGPQTGRRRATVRFWVNVSDVFLDTWAAGEELIVSATGPDGRPHAEVEVGLYPGGAKATTDAEGLTRIPLPDKPLGRQPVLATGMDLAGFLPEGIWPNGQAFRRQPKPGRRTTHLVLDDRGLYRPGETAYLKGFVRVFEDEALRVPEAQTLSYTVIGPRNNDWGQGKLRLGEYGSFDLAVTVPENANLGYAMVRFEGQALRFQHRLHVQAFRRPRFEVKLSAEPGPHLLGRRSHVQVEANAYASGPLVDAPVKWTVRESPARFEAPGWDGWQFGRVSYWWARPMFGPGLPVPSGGPTSAQLEARTDPAGQARLAVEPRAAKTPFPVVLTVGAEVQDVDRRAVSDSVPLLVHPAARAVGLRLPRTFLGEDEALAVDVVAVNLEGQAVEGATVTVGLYPRPGFGDSEDAPDAEALATCALKSGAKAVPCRLTAPHGGRFLVRAEVEDGRGRVSRTEAFAYWSGAPAESTERAATERLEVIPQGAESGQAPTYAPGDTAQVLLRSPLPAGRGYAWVVADGVRSFQPVVVDNGTAELAVPITAALAPAAQLQVWVASTAGRPAQALGEVELTVVRTGDRLAVAVTPPATAAPGQAASVTLEVRDAAGRPVRNAEITVAVVDEAVLALANSPWPEPLTALMPRRSTRIRSWHPRADLVLDRASGPQAETKEAMEFSAEADMAGVLAAPMAAPAGARMRKAGGAGAAAPALSLRTNFSPLAHFEPALHTDAKGQAQLRMTLPDDLTRYRIRAVVAGAGGSRFGRGEASFVVAPPLSIEARLPRFLTPGDAVELPVAVRNRTGQDIEVEVAAAGQSFSLAGPRGLSAVVPAHNEIELRFPAEVEWAQRAVFRAAVRGGGHGDAVQVSLPVLAPALMEAFAEYGALDEGAIARRWTVPEGSADGVGGLEIQVSPTRLLAAKDAFAALRHYPYQCAEQRASKVLGAIAGRGVRALFGDDEAPDLSADLDDLVRAQRPDGGWGYWPRARRADTFLTPHVVHALFRAGRPADADAIERGQKWIARLPEHLEDRRYGRETKAVLLAHAAWVLATTGAPAPKLADLALELGGGPQRAPVEVLAWLYGANQPAKADLRKALDGRITRTAKTAHLVDARDIAAEVVLAGSNRADAVLLLGLLERAPKDRLIEPLLAGLLAGQRASGGWSHTQENAWAVLALSRYAQVKEATPPAFTARAWLGAQLAFEARVDQRDAPEPTTTVPMRWLKGHADSSPLVLARQGQGRMYYRLGLSHALAERPPTPVQRGFTVRRRYEGVDDPEDVQKTDEGWRVKAGAKVRVELEVITRGPRHHVALVDRLPAGLEPLHAERPTSPWFGFEDGWGGWWRGPWDHDQLRDTGAEAFAVDLAPGRHLHRYVARATTPGRFVVGPARAQEMYAEETFGRTAADVVIVR